MHEHECYGNSKGVEINKRLSCHDTTRIMMCDMKIIAWTGPAKHWQKYEDLSCHTSVLRQNLIPIPI